MTTANLSRQPAARPRRFGADASLSRRNRIGLVITFVLGLANAPTIFAPSGPQDGHDGPPFAINALGTVCGLVMIVGCWIAWRAGRGAAIRIAAGASILQALTAVPAFFVDVPGWVKVIAAVDVVITFVGLVLMLASAGRSTPVND